MTAVAPLRAMLVSARGSRARCDKASSKRDPRSQCKQTIEFALGQDATTRDVRVADGGDAEMDRLPNAQQISDEPSKFSLAIRFAPS